MAAGLWTPLAIAVGDGPAVTTTTASTCLPVTAKYTFPPNSIVVGTVLHVLAWGRMSNVVTTPGTARFDVRLGGTVCFDSGAMTLNAVVKTTLPWRLEIEMICRAQGSGTSANLFGFSVFEAENIVGSPLASVGGSGGLLSASASGPETAPAVGGGFDSTIANTFDLFFTQTVTTGTMTVHNFRLSSASPLGA